MITLHRGLGVFRASLILGVALALVYGSGCGSGERELPIVSKSDGKASATTTGVDFPVGKSSVKRSGKSAKSAPPIDIPTGPGNK